MIYIEKDLTSYFENLKNEVQVKIKKKALKVFFYSFLFLESIVLLAYIVDLLFGGGNVELTVVNYLCAILAVTASAMLALIIYNDTSVENRVRILKNNEMCNLYDALLYLHRGRYNNNYEAEFVDFIDAEYERLRLNDLMNNVKVHKDDDIKKKSEINELYEKKHKRISVEKILVKEMSKNKIVNI